MDPRERYSNPSEMFSLAMDSNQAKLWTALPGVVANYPGSASGAQMTVDVQPTINGLVTNKDGTTKWVQMPVLLDCPILWQGGGGVTATFPIQPGDECLVIFSSRCIDDWWQLGGIQNQGTLRMHNLSDGFAMVGVRSLKYQFQPDPDAACIITDDGQTFFKLFPEDQTITMQCSGGLTVIANDGVTMTSTAGDINLNGLTIDQDGNVTAPGTIEASGNISSEADVLASAISLTNHIHPGVLTGGGVTGPPEG